MWRFVVANNQAGNPTWWLYAGNNEMVAWAGETFASTYNASRAASAFKVGSEDRAVRRLPGRRWLLALAGVALAPTRWRRPGSRSPASTPPRRRRTASVTTPVGPRAPLPDDWRGGMTGARPLLGAERLLPSVADARSATISVRQCKEVDAVPRPVPTLLYHFTRVEHLPTIVESGLHCDRQAQADGVLGIEVGNTGSRRDGYSRRCLCSRAAWSRTTSRSTSRRAAR